jgi:glycosyltransferase involved in cell wall biosynthesis
VTKLIIQIPCYNEEQTLGLALAELPTQIDGIDVIERLIINDGSTDNTVQVAHDHSVEHIIDFPRNHGLAKGFMAGIHAALAVEADIIVNTDADNQYNGADITKLVAPILGKQADIVVGARPISNIEHFSLLKKCLQKLGSWVVRATSGTDIADAPSGFRAISREAALRLNVFSEYTYTHETIIQAGQKGMTILSVPIRVNGDLRPSRLAKSMGSYVIRSLVTIFRIFIVYRPLRFFLWLGTIPLALSFVLGVRWLILFEYFPEPGRNHVPSLILASILTLVGFQLWMFGFLADLVAVNRLLLEDLQYKSRKDSLSKKPVDLT